MLAKIRDVIIVVFQKVHGGKFMCQTSTNIFGNRVIGVKSKIMILAHDESHYEPLNIFDPTVKHCKRFMHELCHIQIYRYVDEIKPLYFYEFIVKLYMY